MVGKVLCLGSKKVVLSQVFAGRKRPQAGKEREEEVLVRVSGKFFAKERQGRQG